MGSKSVGADGGYTVSEPAWGGPATVMLVDPNDNVVLLGHVDTTNPSFDDMYRARLFRPEINIRLPAW
jgi:hypothetical protein